MRRYIYMGDANEMGVDDMQNPLFCRLNLRLNLRFVCRVAAADSFDQSHSEPGHSAHL